MKKVNKKKIILEIFLLFVRDDISLPSEQSDTMAKSGTKAVTPKTKAKVTGPKIKKSAPVDDFVLTISDTEDMIPDYDSDSEEEKIEAEVEEKKPKKGKKNNKKAKKAESLLGPADKKEEEEQEVNSDFEFDLDGDTKPVSEDFGGWDFEGDEGKKTTTVAKEVDLDAIIREKGGLDALEESGAEDEEDDDDLALDGFGMGAVEDDDDNEDEEGEDEEEEEGEEAEAEDEEMQDDDGSDAEVVEEDTAEDIAKFYAPAQESQSAKESVHKTFTTLSLSRPIMKGLTALGYTAPSPIQGAVIPVALMGKDVVAGAVTGSGKTAAYLIPILERLVYLPRKVAATRVVVLTPTRELAIQVADVGRKLGQYVGGMRFGLAVGGLNLRLQEQELKTRPDVVIATPGRFIDHVRNSPNFQVDQVEILVVDEADRMLEEGFQKELTEILQLIPAKRQTLLFSATMNSKIKDLVQLSLHRPVRIMINPPKQAAGGLVQEFVRVRSKRADQKPAVLAWLLKGMSTQQRVIIFVSRKETAHRLRVVLGLLIGIRIGELHGALSQEQRLASVNAFKNLEVPVLVCTDLASRGLDIPKIEVVINYDMPKSYEVYLHRVGRTARAGREGRSISLVGEAGAERAIVKDAIKSAASAEGKQGKIVGRNVDWPQIETLFSAFNDKKETIDDILEEEKSQKLLAQAERDIQRGENLIKYEAEIKARPKRTWFETEKEKKQTPKKESKRNNEEDIFNEGPRVYKKTKADREKGQKRSNGRAIKQAKAKKNDKKTQAKVARAKKYKVTK